MKTLITRIEVRIMRLKGRRVKRQRVRCKPPDDVQPDVPNNMLRSLRFRTKQVIKVMRAKDKGDKKTDSNKYK